MKQFGAILNSKFFIIFSICFLIVWNIQQSFQISEFRKGYLVPIANGANQKISDPEQTFKDIESYLDNISPKYIADVQYLASDYKVPSWGCGPSSFALAKIIDQKFFNNALRTTAAYTIDDPDEIVERFSFHQQGNDFVDHAWIEIYLRDKFLFIDPTIGQFGKINKIAYQEFSVGDPNIAAELLNNFGIPDIRIGLLLNKALNRVPIDQQPYPGYTIEQTALDSYLQDFDVRNTVDSGQEPESWYDWVSYLTSRYN